MYSTATPGTFQVSTEDVYLTHPVGSSVDSQTIQLGEERIRIDGSAHESTPHLRAVQLSDFTSWLQQQRQNGAEEIAVHPRREAQSRGQGYSTEKVHRVDPAVSQHVNRDVPQPKFKTANYVEPQVASPAEFVSRPPTPSASSIGIQETIRRLKADGRVIGDLHQAEIPGERGIHVPAFKWPLVTSSLLGSPAILNLEANVQNFLTRELNQIIVTTSRRGDGGTTVAIALARQLAVQGSRVLLIDADIANPMLASRLGLVHQQSWIQVISDRRTALELLVTQNASPISLLPLSPIASQVGWPRKIYDQFSVIANQVAGSFDVVIIDAGPASQLLAESSAPRIRAATTLLVAGQHATSVVDSQRAKAGLLSFGIEEMLLVQNFSQVRSAATAKVG